tara:strand:+ start:57485 stop:57775 length:291 start_codon:yes stop_codon:yes gene_type:complete
MTETIEQTAQLIEKEIIPNLSFKLKQSVKQQDGLMEKLLEATKLGNLHHGKVAIYFRDDQGLKRVETTIWATGLKYICLKGGVWLPISSIEKVVMT